MQRLLEREVLLETLLSAVDRAAAGRGSTVLVEGEAGIGKTSLLQEFASRIDRDAHVCWGWCEALFTPRPLGPLQDMWRSLDPNVVALVEQSASPERLFPALLNMLQTAEQPMVIIFEDVHWADNATLDLVRYLGRRLGLLKTVLVISARSDEIGPLHPLTYVLGDLPSAAVTRMKLSPLSPRAVAQLAGELGRTADDVYRVTGGNPFFVTELLASADDESRIPDSIRDAVWARLSRLPPGERNVLEMLSVVPGNVELALIRALVGEDADDLVERAVGRGLLRRDEAGDVAFRHELARQATLERLSPSLQRSIHARVEAALALGAGGDATSTLVRRVHHAAGAEYAERVLELAPLAAAQASRVGAHQQAASFLSIALKYVAQAPPQTAAELNESWAYEASHGHFDYDAIIDAHHRAIAIWRKLGNAAKVSRNLRLLSRLHWRRGEGDLARIHSDLAVEEVEGQGPSPELAMAYSTRSQLNMLHYRFDEAFEWGTRAIELADELGEIETRVHALNNVGTALLFSGRANGRAVMEEGLQLALDRGFHDHATRAYTNFAEYAVVAKDFAHAERLLAEGIAFAARHDLDPSTQYLLGRQAELRMQQGRLREAETIAQGVIGMERLPVVMHLPALTVLGRVRSRMNEAGADELLARALAEGLPTGEAQRIVPVRLAMVEAAWLVEDLDAARAQLEHLRVFDRRALRTWDSGEIATWMKRSGISDDFGDVISQLPRAWAAELEGDPLAASAEWTRLGLPFEAALCLMQVEGEEAGAALARAVGLLQSIGARQAEALARKQALRLGVRALPKVRRGPYALSRRHPLGLTPTEQQVLRLIAEGRSNKDIARQLKRSPRTIEHQVSSVLGKFSATNRMEVLLRLRSEPWLIEAPERASA